MEGKTTEQIIQEALQSLAIPTEQRTLSPHSELLEKYEVQPVADDLKAQST